MCTESRDERVEIRQPVSWSDRKPASVILRPVPLRYLAELLGPDREMSLVDERRRLAQQLIAPKTRKNDRLAA
jgi:hypothetical protein